VVRELAQLLAGLAPDLRTERAAAVRALLHSYGSCDTAQPYTDAQELRLDV
jgi:hypothetical protein